MKNRLKEVREALADKNKRLDEIAANCDKESRGWNDEEKNEIRTIQSEIDSLVEEREMLEKEEKRKEAKAKEAAKEAEEKRGAPNGNTEFKVGKNKLETEEARDAMVFKMIQGRVSGKYDVENEGRKSLVEGGHYDDLLGKDKEARNFSTLTDTKGGIFLPTTVSGHIFDIEQEYGFIPKNALNLGDIGKGEVKIPNVLTRPAFTAVNEGSNIPGSGLNLGGISLKALKWGTIIDWTNEVSEEAGARLMPIIMRKVAEALAYAKDDAFFNGNGTSSYNDIKGILTLAGSFDFVRNATPSEDHDAFAELTADDWLLPQLSCAPGTRAGGVYVMHPDMLLNVIKLQDGDGRYIYGSPSNVAPAGSIWGKPIVLTEAAPMTDGVSKPAGAFVNPKHVAYGNGRNLSVFQMNQGSITNENGSTVNLGASDAQALRITTLFDLKLDNSTRTTAGTAKGAFSVLNTHS